MDIDHEISILVAGIKRLANNEKNEEGNVSIYVSSLSLSVSPGRQVLLISANV